ncbi:MAG: hypothetical protein KDN19_10030 [Verrucomicrobiae bacterium]|nr:hypothetical protein [Verrucomicrobiae bacterium]
MRPRFTALLRCLATLAGAGAMIVSPSSAILAQEAAAPAKTTPPEPPASQAQPDATPPPPPPEPSEETRSLNALQSLQASIAAIETQIATLRHQLEAAATEAEKEEVAEELRAAVAQRDQMRTDLETVATGVDLEAFEKNSSQPTDLSSEFEDFLRPIVGQLKDLTSKPREIEGLRTDVAQAQRQIKQAENALGHIDELLAVAENDQVLEKLRSLHQEWDAKLEQAQSDLSVAEFKLTEAEKNRSSLFASARDAVASFFRSRGRNFLTAVAVFVAIWFGLRLLYRWLLRFSPLHRKKERHFYVRIIDVVFQAFALLAGVFASMVVLYAASDWVLLGLMLIFIAGLAWTGKQALPHFYEQVKLMLNLGSVREHERIIYNGIPWQVKRINVYTDLENPALLGGRLRLPIRDLVPLHSRPWEPKEQWFPTNEGDWVVLADDTYGRVVQQSPDWVTVIQLGGARKVYPTADFLALAPLDLSRNFRVSITFGIDYQHQAISTDTVPPIFQARLMQDLRELVDGDDIINIGVEFKEAGASSLDYAILADFSGNAASKYQKLHRAIPRICVDVCNEQGWVIPFTQITVHQAAEPESSSE